MGKKFCFVCLREPHSPCDCELVKTFIDLHNSGHGNEINQNFDTFYQRFLAFDESINTVENVFRNEFINIIPPLRDRIKVLKEDIDMMSEAFKFINKVKMTLKYAVVFELFMKECNNKRLFKESQAALERESEELYFC